MNKVYPVKIIANTSIAPNTWLLRCNRMWEFEAGQVVGISFHPDDEPRLYSIASGTQHHEVWILYTVKPGGLLTPQLSTRNKGDTIYMTDPFGNFVCREDKAVWIATGTGIAPFASMFFSGQHTKKKLIQGSRSKDGLYFHDFFYSELGRDYQPCCSRIGEEGCFRGRVTDYLANLEMIDAEIPYYLCGSAEMVVDVRDLLIARGVPFERIMAEIFF